jgi:membrane-bound inhibitor of C-type lysozyme
LRDDPQSALLMAVIRPDGTVMRLLACVLIAASVSAVAAAKTPPKAPTSEQFKYTCAHGKSFRVSFDDDHTFARVATARATYRLPAAHAASGGRYAKVKVEFWEHHGESVLNHAAGGPYTSYKTKDFG